MRWHWQSLMKEPEFSFPWHGRGWLNFERKSLAVEWYALSNRWSASISLDGDEGSATAGLCVGLFSLYLTVGGIRKLLTRILPSRELKFYPGVFVLEDREVSLRFFGGGPWWSFWTDPMGDSTPATRARWWREGHLNLPDLILGRAAHAELKGPPVDAVVPMPEGRYAAVLVPTSSTWTRPRWPWRPIKRSWTGFHVDIPGGIPTEVDDGIWGLSVTGATIEEALANVRERILDSRRRDSGSRNWRPRVEALEVRA